MSSRPDYLNIRWGKRTAHGNIIFASRYRVDGDLNLADPNNIVKLDIGTDTPLKNVKLRTSGGYNPTASTLSPGVREKLEKIGIATIGQLLNSRNTDPVRQIIREVYCNEIFNYLDSLAELIPSLLDPSYIAPATVSVPVIQITGELAKRYRDLAPDIRDGVGIDIQDLINQYIVTLVDRAEENFLRRTEAELEAQLAKVRCKLKGGQNCG